MDRFQELGLGFGKEKGGQSAELVYVVLNKTSVFGTIYLCMQQFKTTHKSRA